MKATIKEMLAQGIKLNGFETTPVELNTVLNLAEKTGAVKRAGEQKHPSGRGKAAVIWEIIGDLNVKFQSKE